jgi:hypothetical protein
MTGTPELRQAPHACSRCGSWYRRGDYCNKCNAYEPDRVLLADDCPMPRQYETHGKHHRMEKIIRY